MMGMVGLCMAVGWDAARSEMVELRLYQSVCCTKGYR